VLFEAGPVVCYGCIPDWWHHQSSEMNLKQRELLEYELKNWLVRCHHAEIIKNPEKVPKDPPRSCKSSSPAMSAAPAEIWVASAATSAMAAGQFGR